VNTSVHEIRIDDSSRYPPYEFLHEDDPSRQYQTNSDISYYITPHNSSLTKLTKNTHVPEVITSNEQNTPYIEDVEGPPNLINTKGTQEQEVQNELINNQPTKESLWNNIETLVSITKLSVPEMTQSQITNHASTSMLIRSMATKLTTASACECLFADFLSEIEPKKVSEALKHPGWVNAKQEELNQFYRNKVWTLVPLPYGKIAIGSKWVLRNKKDELETIIRNKPRLVAQDFSLEEGIDYDENLCTSGKDGGHQNLPCFFHLHELQSLLDGCQKCHPEWKT
ncbi:retrovirus-related pol polyprotein from transposon TNT 1-94, partial [Tanacetum coccineum]